MTTKNLKFFQYFIKNQIIQSRSRVDGNPSLWGGVLLANGAMEFLGNVLHQCVAVEAGRLIQQGAVIENPAEAASVDTII